MKTILKKQRGFTLIELMIVVAIIGVLASIAIPAYKDYVIRTRWAKTIAGLRGLKLAVENCLSDKNADFNECDALDPLNKEKISAYGITQYAAANGDFSSIDLMPNTAAIKITGDKPLANCILYITPAFDIGSLMITWSYSLSSSGLSGSATSNTCANYVKGAVAS